MVGLIVVSVTVSELSVFAILIDLPISVVGNRIWASCSIPVIGFLVIIFPSGVAIIDAFSIFLRQVKKYFFVTALIFFSLFVQFFVCVWFNCSARNYTLIFLLLDERNITILLEIFLSPIFFLCGVIISLSTVIFTMSFKCKLLCSVYAARSFLQLSI